MPEMIAMERIVKLLFSECIYLKPYDNEISC